MCSSSLSRNTGGDDKQVIDYWVCTSPSSSKRTSLPSLSERLSADAISSTRTDDSRVRLRGGKSVRATLSACSLALLASTSRVRTASMTSLASVLNAEAKRSHHDCCRGVVWPGHRRTGNPVSLFVPGCNGCEGRSPISVLTSRQPLRGTALIVSYV